MCVCVCVYAAFWPSGFVQKAATYVQSSGAECQLYLSIIRYVLRPRGDTRTAPIKGDENQVLGPRLPEIEDEDMKRTYQKQPEEGPDKWWPVIMCRTEGDPDQPFCRD